MNIITENQAPVMNTNAPATAPKIELRKIKTCEFMSEETQCYNAEIWVDGVHCANAENEGHGGGDLYNPVYDKKTLGYRHAAFDEGMAKIKAYCATLPPLPAGKWEGATPLEMDVELLIGKLVEDHLKAKDVEKQVNKLAKQCVIIDGGKILHFKKPAAPGLLPQQIASIAKKYPKALILNHVSLEEARKQIAAHLFA